MGVRERILAIRILEIIEKKPEIAKELGISAELISSISACANAEADSSWDDENGGDS